MNPGPLALLAALSTGLTAALVVAWRRPPPPRLDRLLRPVPDPGADPGASPLGSGRLVARLAGGRLPVLVRQAGLARGVGVERAVALHVGRELGAAALTACTAALACVAAGAPRLALPAAALGAFAGASRTRGDLERRIEERRAQLRVELYTVNQLLALDVRAGGGVAQALERIVRRGRGVAADELREVLSAMRGGLPLARALEQAAVATAEPAAARTYRLLAKGAEYGADLAVGLRALSEDLRAARAEALERQATRRRAAMLVPIIALLAPVMLLFIAAPLPSIVFGTG